MTLETPPQTSLIAASADRPGDDPIFALHAEAKARAAAGEDVLDATLGALMEDDGRLSILPAVSEALRRVDPARAAAYAPISGPPAYLDAVVRDLFGEGELARGAVAVATPGGTGAVHHAIVNFLEPGQKVLTTSYYWGPYGILAEHTRRGLETFRMFGADGRFDAESFRAGLERHVDEQGRALVILNTPCHNPTGYSLDDAEWEAVVAILLAAAERAPIALLLDMAYVKFGAPGSDAWQRHVEKLRGQVTVLCAWTGSKAFAQYGSRIGALVGVPRDEAEHGRIKNALGYSCRGTWSNCNHLGMLAITELLSDPELRERSERQRDEVRQLLSERVDTFNQHAQAAGLRYPRYEGGFFVAVFTPDPVGTVEHMKQSGVFVVPLDGAVRLALCATPRASVPRLVDSLAAGIRAVGG
ncbi:MAG: aminotransferase class I/II-fold pyridoxal phosphate-dependent enzyme [Planctomycetota bacterium]